MVHVQMEAGNTNSSGHYNGASAINNHVIHRTFLFETSGVTLVVAFLLSVAK